jgi:curved DNA-binding protein CbpA
MPDRPSSSSHRASARREPARNSGNDLYEILEVSPRASQDVIHAAYRVLARNIHPDHNASFDAASTMRTLNAAYEVLKDPVRRARYDFECNRTRRRALAFDASETDNGSAASATQSRVAQARLQYVGRPVPSPRPRLTPQLAVVLVIFASLLMLAVLLATWWAADVSSMADAQFDHLTSIVDSSPR